jgi:hypothetical protein
VGGIERGHPPGGLEHHRVALDEPALVADPATGETLLGELLGGESRLVELAVDGVDVLLLARDLARGHVIVQRRCPSSGVDLGNGQPYLSGRTAMSAAGVQARSWTNSPSWVRLRHSTIGTSRP